MSVSLVEVNKGLQGLFPVTDEDPQSLASKGRVTPLPNAHAYLFRSYRDAGGFAWAHLSV